VAGFAIVYACRAVLLFFLIPAVFVKLRSGSQFAATLAKWKLMPESVVATTAKAVVALETGVSVLLVVGLFPVWAFAAAAALLLAIAMATWSTLARGIASQCGRFSLDHSERVSALTFGRALALGAVAIIGATSAVLGHEPVMPTVWAMSLIVPVAGGGGHRHRDASMGRRQSASRDDLSQG